MAFLCGIKGQDERPRIPATVDQDVLPDDVAGMGLHRNAATVPNSTVPQFGAGECP